MYIYHNLYLIYEYLLLYCNICFIIRDAYLDSDLFFMKKRIEKEASYKIFLYDFENLLSINCKFRVV